MPNILSRLWNLRIWCFRCFISQYIWGFGLLLWQNKQFEDVMSCHCQNCLSLSMGSRGVAAGANPSLVSGRGQGTPWISRQLIAGPSLMSNVGFSISLRDASDTSTCSSALPGAGIWTSDLPITSRPALPAELQPPQIEDIYHYFSFNSLINNQLTEQEIPS